MCGLAKASKLDVACGSVLVFESDAVWMLEYAKV